MSLDGFWDVIEAQLAELRTAKSADDVLRILAAERSPYGIVDITGRPDEGFFGGSGGDGSVEESLYAAGWQSLWYEASYHYAMRAPDGSIVTYVEGDIYRGNRPPLPHNQGASHDHHC